MNWAWWTLLAAMAALGIVVVVLRVVGYRRLHRLWQYVVASVLAHVALTAGMSLVAISQPVFILLTRDDPDEASVNLVVGHEAQLRTRIRYQVTELPVADPSLAALMRSAVEAIQTPPFERTDLGAPRSEPRQANLSPEPEPTPAPPALDERVAMRPPPREPARAEPIDRAHRPVARAEPIDRAKPERPTRFDAAPPRARPQATWQPTPAPTPAARPRPQSLATPAPRAVPIRPNPVAADVPLPDAVDEPAIELPPRGAPVPHADDQPNATAPPPVPAPPAPADTGSPDRPRQWTASPDAPAARPVVRSLAATPETPTTLADPPTTRPVGARLAVDAPAVEPSLAAAPLHASDPQPGQADPPAVAPTPRPPLGRAGAENRPDSVPIPQRVPPADPLGASLTGHLVAAISPPVADNAPLPRVRLANKLAPLGALSPQRLRVVKPIEHRTPERRKELVRTMGGSTISEAAVARALAYLARNQEPDGRWTYLNEDNELANRREAHKDDTGLTGLAVLCFLAANERPDTAGGYAKAVADGLAYLLARQKPNGDLRGDGDMYSHGIATLAVGEAAVLTRDPAYGEPALRGARFIRAAQNRLTGGWRYLPGSGGDTSVLGWQIMALSSVSRLGVAIPDTTRRGALRWLARVSRGRHGMLAGYQDANPTRTMTAEALFVRLLLGQKLSPAQIAEAEANLKPPDPLEPPNFYSWYYGSLALMQLQDNAWRTWNATVRDRLTAAQHRGGKLDGSWDPSQSRWGGERGGRVYTTAVGTLTLEVYYRYLPMLGPKGADPRRTQP